MRYKGNKGKVAGVSTDSDKEESASATLFFIGEQEGSILSHLSSCTDTGVQGNNGKVAEVLTEFGKGKFTSATLFFISEQEGSILSHPSPLLHRYRGIRK